MAKIYTFAGQERGDFVFYLANILSTRTPAVLVIDNSNTYDLFLPVVGHNEESNSFDKGNITFLKNAAYSESLYEQYDFVLIYQGERFDAEEMKISEHIYFMPDFLPRSLRNMEKFGIVNYENSSVIMRDQTSSKISSRSAAQFLNVPFDRIRGSIPFDFKDYSLYISFSYNGHQSIKNLSPSYAEALMYVIYEILDLKSIREAEALVKKAKKI